MRAKKFIAAAVFAAVALFSGINAYNNSNKIQLSDLALANVEALAYDGEGGEGGEDGIMIKECYTVFGPHNDRNSYYSCAANGGAVLHLCGAMSDYAPLWGVSQQGECYIWM